MMEKEQWVVIINLKSGKKNFRIQMNYLYKQLEQAGIVYEHRITEFAGHATLIAHKYRKSGYRNFLVVGGDGTMNEVLNGIFSTDNAPNTERLKIAQIPRGTGNDWARFWNLTTNYKHAIEVFLSNKTQSIDIGKITYTLEGEPKSHYFINSIGFGLDAKVVNYAHKLKRYVGSHSILYLIALLMAVTRFKPKPLKLKSKEHNTDKTLFTINIANGCYSGGGMKQNPHALPYDGLLDVMLVKRIKFKDIFTALPLLFNGKLLEHPIINSFQSKNIYLDIEDSRYFEADGVISYYASPVEITVLPGVMDMVVP